MLENKIVGNNHRMIQWDTVKREFDVSDGSLRDIYIAASNLGDWRALYPVIRDQPEVEYSVDGVIQELPPKVEHVFAARTSSNPLLRFRVGRTLIVFHFFSEEEIECDISPLEVTSQSDLDALLGFVAILGTVTHKRVDITPENQPSEPFISYTPESGKFEYHAASKL